MAAPAAAESASSATRDSCVVALATRWTLLVDSVARWSCADCHFASCLESGVQFRGRRFSSLCLERRLPRWAYGVRAWNAPGAYAGDGDADGGRDLSNRPVLQRLARSGVGWLGWNAGLGHGDLLLPHRRRSTPVRTWATGSMVRPRGLIAPITNYCRRARQATLRRAGIPGSGVPAEGLDQPRVRSRSQSKGGHRHRFHQLIKGALHGLCEYLHVGAVVAVGDHGEVELTGI